MSHHPVQVVPGTVTEALTLAAARHWTWSDYRLVLIPEDLKPDGDYILIGTWRQRLDPRALAARVTELGIRPAHTEGWASS